MKTTMNRRPEINTPGFTPAQLGQIFHLPTPPMWLAHKLNYSGTRAAGFAALTNAGKERRSLAACKALGAHPKQTEDYRTHGALLRAWAVALTTHSGRLPD